jgi:hypothetical protein
MLFKSAMVAVVDSSLFLIFFVTESATFCVLFGVVKPLIPKMMIFLIAPANFSYKYD